MQQKRNLSFLIAEIIKAKGITQSHLAEIANINRSAIAQFVTSAASLSQKTLLKIAPELDLNPSFISGESDNPFSSKKLIRLFITGLAPHYIPLYLLISYSQSLDLISLIPPLSVLDKIKSLAGLRTLGVFDTGTLFGSRIYAVAAKDKDNNYFIFRRKQKNDFIFWGKQDLQSDVLPMLKMYGKDESQFNFSNKEIDKDLYEKIKDWTVEQEDIEPLFAKKELLVLTGEEEELIKMMRENKVTPQMIQDFIKKSM